MRIIQTGALKPGMVLASPVYSSKGKLLLRENIVLSPSYVSKIQRLDIPYLYIYDKLSKDVEVHDVISIKHLMKAFRAMKKKNYDLCAAVASCIVGDLMDNLEELPNMKQLQSFDNYTFNHSFHVSILCVMVGIELGYREEVLVKLAMAGLMHDIGKEQIPLEIIRKKGALSDEEFEIIKKHPQLGYDMVRDKQTVPAVVKHAILFHHENEDGSGYPKHRKGKEIHEFAKIVHVCDVYDAMVSKRSYKDEMNPADVLEYVMANAGIMFDIHIVQAFRNSIFPYTTGARIVLSDGRTAVVRKNIRGYPDRPDVVIEGTGEKIELRSITNLTIQRFSDEQAIPQQYRYTN